MRIKGKVKVRASLSCGDSSCPGIFDHQEGVVVIGKLLENREFEDGKKTYTCDADEVAVLIPRNIYFDSFGAPRLAAT